MVRFLCLALIAVAAVSAQESPFTLKVDVSMVSVDVSVFDRSGQPVTGLKKNDFAVFEDGRPQEIQTFASSDTPYNVLLVVDRSGSMSAAFPFLIQAVNRFISNLRAQDQFALAAFDESVKRLINWRSVRSGSQQMVRLGAGGNTDFYRALNWTEEELRKIRGRKAALFYTDGEDYRAYDIQEDARAFRRALQNVRRAHAPFHFVGLGVDPERGGERLKRVAEETGGQAHFPESIEEVVPLYDRISRELGISYSLAYLSDRPVRDGTRRGILVKVLGHDYRISQSRTAYSAN
jgi:Ca-activated chloride channel family protein